MTKQEILKKLSNIKTARRGQITEQWYTLKGANGEERKQGPYYVWTWYEDGVKHTARVKSKDIDEVRNEIEKGKEVARLIGEYWKSLESESQEVEKKTTHLTKSKYAKKSTKPST